MAAQLPLGKTLTPWGCATQNKLTDRVPALLKVFQSHLNNYLQTLLRSVKVSLLIKMCEIYDDQPMWVTIFGCRTQMCDKGLKCYNNVKLHPKFFVIC